MKKENELPELSKAEWAVMEVVWRLNRTVAREVHEELKESQEWALSTVRTMMERLRRKGYLSGKKIGKTYLDEPRARKREVVVDAVERFSDRLFDGAIGPLVACLVEENKLSPEETREIQRLLKSQEEKRNENKDRKEKGK